MPRVSYNQANFTAGEMSPRMRGRTDIDRYANAARLLVNSYPVIHGGVRRRPGTRYVAPTKFANRKCRLIPFVFSRDVSYMLEFGHNYVRVFGASGVFTGVELPTGYSEDMLPDIDFAQGADTMFIAHPTVPIQRLRRLTATIFDFSQAPFTVTPFDEQGHTPPANIALSAITGSITVTADASVFLPSDVGRTLISGAGTATITGYVSAAQLQAAVTVPFPAFNFASGTWLLDASPMAIVKPTAKDPIAAVIDLAGSLTRAAKITLGAKTGTAIVVTADAAVFAVTDVGLLLYAENGVGTITTFTDSTHIKIDVSADFASLAYSKGSYGITGNTWRTEDVGKFVRINSGLVKITELVSADVVHAQVIQALTSSIASPPLGWSLESAVWSAANGFPRTLTLHEQRLIAAGSTRFPQTIWGSRIGEYLDYTKGTNDSDSYSFTIAADEVNPISYVAPLRNLVVHTYGGEFSMQSGVEKPITPTNVRVRPESTHGSKGVRPVTVGNESVFVQRAGKKIRSLGYRAVDELYSAPDLTVLAEHITQPGGVVGMAYQQEPDLLLWALRSDGALMTCTLDREQSVIGWGPGHYTQGWFESIASIPSGDRDDTWVVVKRVINGAVIRYLEVFDDTFQPMLPGAVSTDPPSDEDVAAVTYGYTADCALVFDNAAGQTVFNVPHLTGCIVDIVADGAVMPQQSVPVGGVLTLPRKSFRTLIGLHFDSKIGLLTPEIGTGSGTAQGNSMRASEVTLRFLNTIGATVLDGEGNEQEVPFRKLGAGVLDKPPAPFTGNVRIEMLGWERGKCELTIVQNQPLPMHLLSVVRKFTVNDG